MKQTKTYCDTCGAEIKRDYGVVKGELKLTKRSNTGETDVDLIIWDDLCHKCRAELFVILTKFAEVGGK